jgi:acyl carrier protein
MDDIKSKVRDYIVENFLFGDGDGLKEDTSFLAESIIDSTGILELVAFIEEQFEIKVADDELVPKNLDSLDNIAVYVQGKRQ